MAKPLTQITFEFSTAQENSPEDIATDVVAPVTTKAKKEPRDNVAKKTSTRGRRSLKDTGLSADLLQIPDDEILFSKQYYSIGEVAAMFRENQSLIRYWETEFDILQPRKNRKGDRFFRPVDIKNLALIYDLLRRRKFTIEGAKDYLKKNKKAEEKFAMIQSLEKIKTFLLELKASL
jgi:DNA-binding transcriptional MerR regulator